MLFMLKYCYSCTGIHIFASNYGVPTWQWNRFARNLNHQHKACSCCQRRSPCLKARISLLLLSSNVVDTSDQPAVVRYSSVTRPNLCSLLLSRLPQHFHIGYRSVLSMITRHPICHPPHEITNRNHTFQQVFSFRPSSLPLPRHCC